MFVQMDARSIVSVAFRQMRKFLMVVIPINVLAFLYVLTATPAFESTASLLVKFGQDARPEAAIEGNGASGLSAEEKRGMVQSNLNILTSRDLADALVKEMGLARLYPDLASASDDPVKTTNAAVKAFMTDLKSATKADAGIITVSYFHEDRALATEALNRLLDLFIRRQAEIFGNPQSGALTEQSQQAAQRLEEANRQFSEFKLKNGIAELDEELALLLRQRGDMTGYLSRREALAVPGVTTTGDIPREEMVAQPELGALPARIPASGDSSRFPVLEDIQKRIDEMRAKEAELLLTYRADSDVVQTLRRNIVAEERNLDGSLRALAQQVADLDRQIAQKQAFRSEYDSLKRAVMAAEAGYKTAQERLTAAQVNDDLNQRKITRISVIQQPTAPDKASRPQKLVTLILSFLASLAFGGAAVLFAELFDQTFSRSEQLHSVLDKPVLTSFSRRSRRDEGASRQELTALLQALENTLPAAGRGRIIQLGSCYSGEGISTISYDFAHYVAESLKRRVLVLELSATSGHSLLDVVLGRATPDKVISSRGPVQMAALATTQQTDLVLAQIGALTPLFEQLRNQFDLVLLATSGVLQSPAALAVSKLADGVVVVVEAERTRAPVLRQLVSQLSDVGAGVIGTVLNKRNYYIPGWLYGRL